MKLRVFLIVGARPNFMKIAPLYTQMKLHPDKFDPMIVHTGQHYDENMSKIFFDELQLPKPDIYLGVGSGSHGEQTGKIMRRFEPELLQHQPDLVLVVGDVNSTIACAMTAIKARISSEKLSKFWQNYENQIERRNSGKLANATARRETRSHAAPIIAHVESGERSFDRSMPEEVNRILTDVISDFLFTTSEESEQNLINEGIDPRKIFSVGNIMIDSLLNFLPKAKNSMVMHQLNDGLPEHFERITDNNFALVTLHRAGNVDDPESLKEILSAFVEISPKIPIIFPMHPRTRKLLSGLDDEFLRKVNESRILIIEPLGYLDFLHLQTKARLVLTDSGGVQVETSYLGVPCLTLRSNTEWQITLREGTNTLVSPDKKSIVEATERVLQTQERKPVKIHNWDGYTAERIVNLLNEIFQISGK